MKDPKNREMMLDLYRLYERYEEPQESDAYWLELGGACNEACAK